MSNTGGQASNELMEITRSLQASPADAETRLKDLLARTPDDPNAIYLYAISLRLQGKLSEAQDVFQKIIAGSPGNARAHQDLGITFLSNGQLGNARAALTQALQLDPNLVLAWQGMSDILAKMGDNAGAQNAAQQAQMAQARSGQNGQAPQNTQGDAMALQQARDLLQNGQVQQAEAICRALLSRNPKDPAAMCLLAAIGIEIGAVKDAKRMLEDCLKINPDYHMARINLASAHRLAGDFTEALAELEIVEKAKPGDPNVILVRCKVQFDCADYDNALAGYEDVNSRFGKKPETMMEYGNTLRAVGRKDDAILAYRETEALAPGNGLPWFALANLKTGALNQDDIGTLRKRLEGPGLSGDDEYLLAFALGTALEDKGDWQGAYSAYERGNRVHRKTIQYDTADDQRATRLLKEVFDADLIAANKAAGCQAPDPIFIIGLPRSGSTLVEQILASHSQVEGTFELPDMNIITERLGRVESAAPGTPYPACVKNMSADELAALGQSYIDRTQIRRSGNVYFIDKNPSNFVHAGFIKMTLPNAKIIDTRRSPMANCFSMWRQLFASGNKASYDFDELGAWYCDYIDLMDHWNALFPGGILTVHLEELVNNTEEQVRAILDFCGLDFEEACLTPHKTERVVRTASSEQVRQPINDSSLEQWRHFETWLGPLRAALEPIASRYDLDQTARHQTED